MCVLGNIGRVEIVEIDCFDFGIGGVGFFLGVEGIFVLVFFF